MTTQPPDHTPSDGAPPSQPPSQPPQPLPPPAVESTVAGDDGGEQPGQTPTAAVTPAPTERGGSSRGRVVGGIAVAVALVGAGVFAATRIVGGDDAAAGASSPDELGERALEVFDDADVLGAVNLLLPGERQTLGEPMIELVRELERLDILSDVNLSGVQGVDVDLAEPEVQVVETDADDIVYVQISADVSSRVDVEELPTGGLLDELTSGPGGSSDEADAMTVGDDSDERDGDDEDDPADEGEPFSLRLVGVEHDGQWYLSVWYWIAEAMRVQTSDPDTGVPPPIPTEGIEARGGETPEEAITLVTDALGERDLETIIGAINPNEASALQRYAPLFLEDAQRVFDDSGLEIDVNDVEVRAEGGGDERQVYIDKLVADISFDLDEADLPIEVDEGTLPLDEAHVVFEDGCLTVEGAAQSVNTCELDAAGATRDDFRELLDEQLGESEHVAEFIDAAVAAFDDFETPGLTVSQVDGQWYISPMSTGWTWLLAITGALDADELEHLVELGGDAFEEIEDEIVLGD